MNADVAVAVAAYLVAVAAAVGVGFLTDRWVSRAARDRATRELVRRLDTDARANGQHTAAGYLVIPTRPNTRGNPVADGYVCPGCGGPCVDVLDLNGEAYRLNRKPWRCMGCARFLETHELRRV